MPRWALHVGQSCVRCTRLACFQAGWGAWSPCGPPSGDAAFGDESEASSRAPGFKPRLALFPDAGFWTRF